MLAQSQSRQSGGQGFGSAIPRGRLFWLSLVLLGFVAMMALGSSHGEVSIEAKQVQGDAGTAQSADQPVFDGRGKWTGYAR